MKRRCKICQHWDRTAPVVTTRDEVVGEIGFCKRRAPVIATAHNRRLDAWPSKADSDRCGEFELNEGAEA